MRKEQQELWTLIEPYVADAGFELAELEFGREPSGWVLRVYIDQPEPPEGQAPAPISHADCERVSRDLSAALDVADKIPYSYHLEVSSPGIDRPLRRERDFARFTGRRVKIRLSDGVEGRRNFVGTLRGTEDGHVNVEVDGRSYRLPIEAVAKAHLVPDWDQEFHTGANR